MDRPTVCGWSTSIAASSSRSSTTRGPQCSLDSPETDGASRLRPLSLEQGVCNVLDLPNGKPTQIATSPILGLIEPEWSPDDRALIGTDNLNHIVSVRLDAPGEPATIVPNGSQPRLSPDGRWLAYTSTISGAPEVYVQSFPGGGDRRRVSAQGGVQPRWRGDGAELFYLTAEGAVMALSVRSGSRFDTGPPTQLFRDQSIRSGPTPFDRAYLPTRDGQRFLLHVPAEGPVPLTAVRNWLTPVQK